MSTPLKTFLCRVYRGDHLLHVHDQPSYYADILRHQEMGWEMSDTCQLPQHEASDGNPGVKPFQAINLMHEREPGGDDHHRKLHIDYTEVKRLLSSTLRGSAYYFLEEHKM